MNGCTYSMSACGFWETYSKERKKLTPNARRVRYNADDGPTVAKQAEGVASERIVRVDLQRRDFAMSARRTSASRSLFSKGGTHSGVIKPSPRAMIANGLPWRWNGCGGPSTF